jgi:septin 7
MSDYSSRDGLSQNGYANTSNPSLVPSQNAAASPVIRKKLMGFVGFSNLPNQVHRKSVRKGFQFTAMVVGESFTPSSRCVRKSVVTLLPLTLQGESGLGKSTLINTLFNTKLYQPKEPLPPSAERPKTVAIESISAGSFSIQ